LNHAFEIVGPTSAAAWKIINGIVDVTNISPYAEEAGTASNVTAGVTSAIVAVATGQAGVNASALYIPLGTKIAASTNADYAAVSGVASQVVAGVTSAIVNEATNLAAGSAAALYVTKTETNGAEWGSHSTFVTNGQRVSTEVVYWPVYTTNTTITTNLVVTGSLTPDVTGTYTNRAANEWQRDTTRDIRWDGATQYGIEAIPPSGAFWIGGSYPATVPGAYSPYGGGVGTATVAYSLVTNTTVITNWIPLRSAVTNNTDDFLPASTAIPTTNGMTGIVFIDPAAFATAAQGAKADNALTNNYVGDVVIGGTVSASNGTETNHLVTVGQWEAGLVGNVDIYASATKITNYPPTNAMYLGASIATLGPQTLVTNVCETNGAYIYGWVCTNETFTTVPAQTVSGVIYIGENMPRTVIGKVEIYRIDVATGTITEWGDGGAAFTVTGGSATPTRVAFEVGVVAVTETSPFYLAARFKRTSGTANAGDEFFVGVGTNYQTHITFSVQTSVLLEPYLKKSGGTMTGALVQNGAGQASWTPYAVPFAASNVISLANGDLQSIDLFGQGACTVYLPNSPTNQFHSLTLQINPSTNTLTIATNGLVTVTLATNPVFNLPASTWTTCQFWKQYDTNYWKGASLQ
jgi:hypothetical protein